MAFALPVMRCFVKNRVGLVGVLNVLHRSPHQHRVDL